MLSHRSAAGDDRKLDTADRFAAFRRARAPESPGSTTHAAGLP